MASTFTGLKLQGELGRFGTTELTDIEGKAQVKQYEYFILSNLKI
jgi:hypothetical protein